MRRLEYFVKRFLLVIPTFLGITIVCFTLIQFVPGGPGEQLILQMKGLGAAGGEVARGAAGEFGISEEQRQAIMAEFGFDKPIYARYWKNVVEDRLWMQAQSFKYKNKTAWELVSQRFPVSLIFGITGFILTYLVCIPLGVAKALRNGSPFDMATSFIVFVGYAIPAFSFGMILQMLLSGTVEGMPAIFPHAGFISENFHAMSFAEKARDLARHMFLPVLCYMIGHFAVLTLLMKNSLLDVVAQDYVRTARAKGCSRSRTIWVHAFRNSLIPIATGFGGVLTVMFAGSVLIEQVFEIPGMGRLGLEAVVSRDYPVFMAILALTSILGLIGNILSDFCYILIDPRIDFAK